MLAVTHVTLGLKPATGHQPGQTLTQTGQLEMRPPLEQLDLSSQKTPGDHATTHVEAGKASVQGEG